MPPKKDGPSKKVQEKAKAKVVEDKTFGMKNKKGAKAQKFIQQVQKQVFNPNQKVSAAKQQEETLKKKEEEKKKKEELNDLFRPVAQVVSKGADPKSVLCAFFKQGLCGKGAKCKFSHDLTIERKSEKRSLYVDERDGGGGAEDAMEGWDQAKLEDVVDKKHGSQNKSLPPTTIICKYFLEAVEDSKYGWFWECPNGEKCHYRHALPPGYVLAKDKKKLAEQKETITLEELIERERALLGANVTKVTFESFMAWKAKKRAERIKLDEERKEKKVKDFKSGKMFGVSGRDLFTFNPDLIAGDDEEADDTALEREPDEDEEEEKAVVKDIDLSDFSYSAGAKQFVPEIRADITVATEERFAEIRKYLQKEKAPIAPLENGGSTHDSDKLEGAAAIDPEKLTEEAIAVAMAATLQDGDVPIDENLFGDDDLDELDEDLEQLDLQ